MKLIVGLGNPGKGYEFTRHNLGFLTVSLLLERFNATLKACSFTKGMYSEVRVGDEDICFLLPMMYMNNSGVAVKQFSETRNICHDDILVICDDYNLEFGQIRVRSKGGDGGHNGLSSVIYHIVSEGFARIRMGIGNAPKNQDAADYVLEEFSKKERGVLDDFIGEAADCCVLWAKGEINKAMEKYNRRKENGKD